MVNHSHSNGQPRSPSGMEKITIETPCWYNLYEGLSIINKCQIIVKCKRYWLDSMNKIEHQESSDQISCINHYWLLANINIRNWPWSTMVSRSVSKLTAPGMAFVGSKIQNDLIYRVKLAWHHKYPKPSKVMLIEIMGISELSFASTFLFFSTQRCWISLGSASPLGNGALTLCGLWPPQNEWWITVVINHL